MPNIPTVYDTDESLADALQEASKEALNILYDRYAPTLFGVLQKTTGDNDAAEEALQICFVNIWQNKNLYNSSKERLFTWMFKIAKDSANVVIEKEENLKNHNNQLYVSDDNLSNGNLNNTALITELLIFGNISQEEAVEKMGISIIELRQIIRKEINKLRGV